MRVQPRVLSASDRAFDRVKVLLRAAAGGGTPAKLSETRRNTGPLPRAPTRTHTCRIV